MELRTHQAQLQRLIRTTSGSVNFVLMHVTPGGGKSLLPQIAFKELSELDLVDRICWVVPRDNLRNQGASDFCSADNRNLIGHQFEIWESSNDCDPCRGTNGYVTTYQAIGMDSSGINEFELLNHRYLLVLDELHHVAEGQQWHQRLIPLVEAASFVLVMTGTLDRHDGRPIAFLPYREVRHVAA